MGSEKHVEEATKGMGWHEARVRQGVETHRYRGDDVEVGLSGRLRRSSVAVLFVFEMVDYLAYEMRLSDESHDAHVSAARTEEGVELEDALYHIRPSSSPSLLPRGADGGLVFSWLV